MSDKPFDASHSDRSIQVGGNVGGSIFNTGIFTVVQNIEPLRPTQSHFSSEQLRDALHSCGALLRGYKHTIANTGKHIRRRVVEDILAWAQQDEADLQTNGQWENGRVGVLLDQAGMGKTTVARDVTLALEEAGFAVLAIKADQQLSQLRSPDEVSQALQLPDAVESIVGRLAQEQDVAIVIDQIDALSLALSHDQQALDLTLGMVARLRDIPNVRVLISCRTFDLHSDPHFRDFLVCRHFALPLLEASEARPFVEDCGLKWEQLSPATQELLRVPLHLDLFVKALENQTAENADGFSVADVGYGVTTLQDLYRLLWDKVIRRDRAGAPPVAERECAVERLTQQLVETRKTSAPRSFFSRPENAHLEKAVRWLVSEGILLDTGQDWAFLHQTFIDYCAAKAFVEGEGNLTETILSGAQDLLARPQLLQTLAYLRGSHAYRDEYLQQLQSLFAAPTLREHLRVLLFGWFGGLRNPDDNEWRLASRVLRQPEQRAQLLGWMSMNPVWFARIRETLLPTWMNAEDAFLDQSVLPYLRSLSGVWQEEIATLLDPFVGRSSAWNQRIFTWVSNLREWQSEQAVKLFEKVIAASISDALSRNEKLSVGHIWSWQKLTEYDLVASCRILRCFLDGLLEVHRAHPRELRYPNMNMELSYAPVVSLAERLEELNGSAVRELLEKAPQKAPKEFLDEILPWVENAVRSFDSEDEDDLPLYDYRRDALHDLWHGTRQHVRHLIAQSSGLALVQVAGRDKAAFDGYVARLESWECLTPHQILVSAFQTAPELLADEAAQYLLEDRRRLDLGDRDGFDSRRLITLICPHLSESRRDELQNFIVGCSHDARRWKGYNNHLLEYRGKDELLLLEAFPADSLNTLARAELRELRSKFPDCKASDSPSIFRPSRDREALPLERALKISDRAWLRLFQRANQTPSAPDQDVVLNRRDRGLSGALINSIVVQPERFYRLMQHLKEVGLCESLALGHRQAFIEGFAGAVVPLERRIQPMDEEAASFQGNSMVVAPVEWLFEAIRLFAPPPGIQGYTPDKNFRWSETRWRIAHNLERQTEILPTDLVNLLESYVRTQPYGDVDVEETFEKERLRLATKSAHDSRNAVHNHERALSLRVLMGALTSATNDAGICWSLPPPIRRRCYESPPLKSCVFLWPIIESVQQLCLKLCWMAIPN